jgi:hypothetical protein
LAWQLAGRIVCGRSQPETGALAFETGKSALSRFLAKSAHPDFIQIRCSELIGKRPEPGVYIISAHHVIRMRQADPAWRTYEPVDRIGESLWVFNF